MSCGNWTHRRCAKIKRVISRFAIDFKCRKCKGFWVNLEDQKEKLYVDVEAVNDFYIWGIE